MIKHKEDFRCEALRMALTSGLSRRRVAADLGVASYDYATQAAVAVQLKTTDHFAPFSRRQHYAAICFTSACAQHQRCRDSYSTGSRAEVTSQK